MNLEKFKEQIFAEGKKYGFTDMELYQDFSRSFELRVFDQEIDHYSINEDRGLSFRGLMDKKLGYAYTEKLDESSINRLLENASQNAKIIDKKEGVIFSGSKEYKDLNPFSPELTEVKPEDKIGLVKTLEKEALSRDKRVTAVNYCIYADDEIENRIINTRGIDLYYRNNFAYMFISVVARDGDEIRSTSKFVSTKDFNKLDTSKLACEAVDETISLFGARSLPSGNYPVILRHDVAASILATFSSTLSAENVQKGMSLFAGKIGERVAAPRVNIIDDPFMKGGFRTTPFDDEGVATRKKNIVDSGTLTTYLHNLKTAIKDGVETTGNAYRGSHKSSINIAPTNMYIEKGNTSFNELVGSLEEGLVIIDVQGLHSGADPISGEFSLSAFGFYVKNGKMVHPVEQITIAGNFMEILKDIVAIGDDFHMELPQSGHYGSPSIKIKNLAVAGE